MQGQGSWVYRYVQQLRYSGATICGEARRQQCVAAVPQAALGTAMLHVQLSILACLQNIGAGGWPNSVALRGETRETQGRGPRPRGGPTVGVRAQGWVGNRRSLMNPSPSTVPIRCPSA